MNALDNEPGRTDSNRHFEQGIITLVILGSVVVIGILLLLSSFAGPVEFPPPPVNPIPPTRSVIIEEISTGGGWECVVARVGDLVVGVTCQK